VLAIILVIIVTDRTHYENNAAGKKRSSIYGYLANIENALLTSNSARVTTLLFEK